MKYHIFQIQQAIHYKSILCAIKENAGKQSCKTSSTVRHANFRYVILRKGFLYNLCILSPKNPDIKWTRKIYNQIQRIFLSSPLKIDSYFKKYNVTSLQRFRGKSAIYWTICKAFFNSNTPLPRSYKLSANKCILPEWPHQ